MLGVWMDEQDNQASVHMLRSPLITTLTRQLRVSGGDDDDNDNTIDGTVIEMLQWKNDPKKCLGKGCQ